MRSRTVAVGIVLIAGCGGEDGRGESGGNPTAATLGGDAGDTEDNPDDNDTGEAGSSEDGGPEDDGSDDDDASDTDDDIFDVGAPGGGDCGQPEFSFLWVANSGQGTISKINTESLAEEGRYYVRADNGGSPSRTSVNLTGDVAVGARFGGLTKVYADPDNCDAGATSMGKDDVKAWPDPCVAWHTEFNYSSQRGVAWIPATFNEQTCEYENEKLWTTGTNGTVEVVLVDGETGTVEMTVPVGEVNGGGYGVYGAAVDGAGNFWGWVPSGNDLLFVDRDTFEVQVYDAPHGGYGIAVDKNGRPWLCSGQVSRFDPVAATWSLATESGSGAGCMEDGQGTLWVSRGNGLQGIDIETLAGTQHIALGDFIKGISIQLATDDKVFVWGVTMGARAYKADPTTGTAEYYEGLNSPYTYSDMTGFGLYNAGNPSG